MGDSSREWSESDIRRGSMATMVAVLLLPAVAPGLFGWLAGFAPLPFFYSLIRLGKPATTGLARMALLIAGGVAVLFGGVPRFLFAATLVPLGFVFFQAARQKLAPIRTGRRGVLVLGGAWLLFWTVYGLANRMNPYTALLASLDQGLADALSLYQDNAGISDATRLHIAATIEYLRRFLPLVVPALLGIGVLITVWMNLALGNRLVKLMRPELAPWPDFREWQLPAQLVWPGIACGIGVMVLPGVLKIVCVNGLLFLGALFFLQGLAVLISQLMRWSVPKPLRVGIYLFIAIQTYGIMLLAFLGLADVWADFRKLNNGEEPDTPIPPRSEQLD